MDGFYRKVAKLGPSEHVRSADLSRAGRKVRSARKREQTRKARRMMKV